jgi:hypothetical protein
MKYLRLYEEIDFKEFDEVEDSGEKIIDLDEINLGELDDDKVYYIKVKNGLDDEDYIDLYVKLSTTLGLDNQTIERVARDLMLHFIPRNNNYIRNNGEYFYIVYSPHKNDFNRYISWLKNEPYELEYLGLYEGNKNI